MIRMTTVHRKSSEKIDYIDYLLINIQEKFIK